MDYRISPYGTLVAAALIAADGSLDTPAHGIASVSAPVLSVYTITLSNPIAETDCGVFVTLNALAGSASVAQSSPTSLTVSTFDAAGAPADRRFFIEIVRKAVG